MAVRTETIELSTPGHTSIHDLTATVAAQVRGSGFADGLVTVFCPGSTGGITTIEFEPGLVEDMQRALERLVPTDLRYRHNELNHDDNGHSHVRAGLVGPSLSIPFTQGRLTLGTWQQIVLLDFDSGPRRRRLVVQVMGE